MEPSSHCMRRSSVKCEAQVGSVRLDKATTRNHDGKEQQPHCKLISLSCRSVEVVEATARADRLCDLLPHLLQFFELYMQTQRWRLH